MVYGSNHQTTTAEDTIWEAFGYVIPWQPYAS